MSGQDQSDGADIGIAGVTDGRRERNPIAAVTRLVSAIADLEANEVGVRELARILEAPPSSVQKTLDKALEAGLVAQGSNGQWQLGWEMFRIASMVLLKMPFASVQPTLDALSEATGETAVVTVYDQRSATRMFVAAAPSRHSIRFVPDLLSWMPMTLGATAIAILAHRPREEQERILMPTQGSGRAASKTLDTMLTRLETVRDLGFATSRDEVNLGASGLAAPIFGASGVMSSIGVIGPAQRFSQANHDAIAALVREAARSVGSTADS